MDWVGLSPLIIVTLEESPPLKTQFTYSTNIVPSFISTPQTPFLSIITDLPHPLKFYNRTNVAFNVSTVTVPSNRDT